MEEIEKQLKAVQLQTNVIDSCTESLSYGKDGERVCETLCLVNLSNLELLERRVSGIDKTLDRIESSTQCNPRFVKILRRLKVLPVRVHLNRIL